MIIIECIFIILTIIILYTILFPVLLYLSSFLFSKKDWTDEYYPSVTTITCAYNEASVIQKKMENLISLEYPGTLKHIVLSDGSVDATNEILKKYIHVDAVTIIILEKNSGKTYCQNTAMELVDTEIALFTDANTMLTNMTLTSLLQPFQADAVGCTTGNIILSSFGTNIESIYWKFENRIKQAQSALHSTIGATGGLYAIRTNIYKPQENYILSDFIVPLTINKQGYRSLFVTNAIAHEVIGEQTQEKKRKARILARALQSFGTVIGLLNPFRYPYFSFMIISYKLLRWLLPILFTITFIVAFTLYTKELVLVTAAYIVLSGVLRGVASKSIAYKSLQYMHIIYLGGLRGWWNFLQKKKLITWNVERT